MAQNKDVFDAELFKGKKEKYDHFPFVDGEKLTKKTQIDRKVQNEDYNKFLKEIGSMTPGRSPGKYSAETASAFGKMVPSSWQKHRPIYFRPTTPEAVKKWRMGDRPNQNIVSAAMAKKVETEKAIADAASECDHTELKKR